MSLIVNQIKAIFPNIHSLNKDEIVISKNATFPTLLLKLREKADNEAIEPYWMDIKKWYELNDKERFENTIKGLSYKNTIEYQYYLEVKIQINKLQ